MGLGEFSPASIFRLGATQTLLATRNSSRFSTPLACHFVTQSHQFLNLIFSKANGMIQYTNVLVGFSLDACKDTLTLRPYIKLKDMTTGEIVTLYGGCVCRSIYQVAQQNENTYKPGTAGYKDIHEILDYSPTAEQGGETK